MQIRAHAKINVGLDIVGRRSDGYHELKTVFYELRLADEVTLQKCDGEGINLTCSDSSLSAAADNLAYRAAALLREEFGIREGLRIHLQKNIPMGAGLGGGSSDAAAVLKGVNELSGLKLTEAQLCERAAALGADVPFFIRGGCALATGIGEKLTGIDGVHLPPMLLIKPPAHVPTAWAYAAADRQEKLFHPDLDALVDALQKGDYEKICAAAGNSFEEAVFADYPQIRVWKERMLRAGAGACVMTGSGSALFAFFREEKEVRAVKNEIEAGDAEVRVFAEIGGV